MDELREWPALIERTLQTSPLVAELAALTEPELEALLEFLASEPALPYRYLSVHAPSKERCLSDAELVALIEHLPPPSTLSSFTQTRPPTRPPTPCLAGCG